MLSVQEAKKLIRQNISPLPAKITSLGESCGYILAEDVYAQVDVPFYPQSSMDGFAFKFDSLGTFPSLKVIGKVQAGSEAKVMLKEGEAVRIFTGAPVPSSADTVVMQEKTRVEGDQLYVLDDNITLGTNVRLQGSEIEAGALGLSAGQLIRPAAIGFLASVGVSGVSVISKPKVSLIVTGDELQEVGSPLSFGQVYESNSHTVKAALAQFGITDIQIHRVKDNLDGLIDVLRSALLSSDMVLLTGGISVGEYDFVGRATALCEIDQVFHKITQKPGKPIYFGKKEDKVVFGLPGNPASVLTCLYQYVTIALDRLSGTNLELKTLKVPVSGRYKKPKGITHFLKGYYDGSSVLALEGQESYKLNSFAKSNCLIEVPEDIDQIDQNDLLTIHLIP